MSGRHGLVRVYPGREGSAGLVREGLGRGACGEGRLGKT